MRLSPFSILVSAVLTVTGMVLLTNWLKADITVELRLSGNDNTPDVLEDEGGTGVISGTLVKFDGVASELPGTWPRFRGTDFDGISKEEITLKRSWDVEGPKELWSVDLGKGYASAAVLNGMVYLIDYDMVNKADVIRCLSLEDGRDIWQYSYPVKVKEWHGMSRTIPAVTDDFVVTMGPRCHVTCLNAKTGRFLWMINLVKDYGTKVPDWHTGQCPIIDNNKAIIAPGGTALIMAVNCSDSRVLWETPNPDGWTMTHSSIMPMTFGGKRFFVYCGGNAKKGGVVGVSADDGSILWQTDVWKMRTNVPSPVVIEPDRIFLCAGYGKGSMMLKLTEENGRIIAKSLYTLDADTFGAVQQTPIFYENHLYGIRPDGQFVCFDLEGNIIWTSTSAYKFGNGPFIIADGLIYAMNDTSLLRLFEATSAGYNLLAEAKVLDSGDSWGPMAIVSGRLLVRDLNRMVCLDVAQR